MRSMTRLFVVLTGILLSHSANAGLFDFSYVFDASRGGTAGHVLAGTVEGELQADGDTIVINQFLSASLAGFEYNITNDIGIRAANPLDAPTMSLSGNTLDFLVCPQGFTSTFLGGGDCPFGNEGGFLISYDIEFGTGGTGGEAHAGIPDLEIIGSNGNNVYRDSDFEINVNNWSASAAVPEPAPTILLSLGLLALITSRSRKFRLSQAV